MEERRSHLPRLPADAFGTFEVAPNRSNTKSWLGLRSIPCGLRLSGFDGRSKIPPDLILGKFGIVLPHAAQKCPTPKGQ